MTARAEYATTHHPFVGLRAFGYADRDFFFGRREQLDVLEPLVSRNRFVAIVGSSGSGKSSLIRAGLLPRLESRTAPWRWAEMRPGEAPIRALAMCLGALGARQAESGGADPLAEARADRIELLLRRSSFGIPDSAPLLPSSPDQQLLLLIDQFEELFRFADLDNEAGLNSELSAQRREEATAFVRLLLVASGLSDLPIHIVITMRSDFIGECARFHGLPEIVTANQFLVPGLTRDQRAAAICGPVQRARGSIDPELVQRALNDTTEDPDQLPILQHVMMRCWQRASKHVSGPPSLTANDYKEVGGATGALSVHANEILDDPSKDAGGDTPSLSFNVAAKRVFQALTDVDKAGRVVRRPQRFGDLYKCALVEEDEDKDEQDQNARKAVAAVVGRFADPECSFLRAPLAIGLHDDSVIDIGHEALIRRWDKLKGGGEIDWIREEQEDAEQYRGLVRTARANATIPAEELPNIERWWLKRKPNRFWAQRYYNMRIGEISTNHFDDVIALLLRSQLKAEELERQRNQAERAEREAHEAKLAAETAESKRQAAEAVADSRKQKFRTAVAAGVFLVFGLLALLASEIQKHNAQVAQIIAEDAAKQAEGDKARLAAVAVQAQLDKEAAASREKSFRARVMAFAAERILSPGLAAGAADALAILLAKPAQLPDVIEYQRMLFQALGELRETRRIVDLPAQPFSVGFSPTSKLVTAITPVSDGGLLHFWNRDDGTLVDSLRFFLSAFSNARWSPDGERILIGSSPFALVLTPCSSQKLRPYFSACNGKVDDIIVQIGSQENPAAQGVWDGGGTRVLTGGFQREAKLWNAITGSFEGIWNSTIGRFSEVRNAESQPAAGVAFSADGKRIAVGSPLGEIFVIDARTLQLEKKLGPNSTSSATAIFSLVFDPTDSNILLSTSQNAVAHLWEVSSGASKVLPHDLGGVFQGAFDPKGRFLSTASEDGTVRIWRLENGEPSRDTILLRGHRSAVFSVDVSADGSIVSGSSDRTVRFWNLRSPLTPNFVGERSIPDTEVRATIDGEYLVVAKQGSEEFRTLTPRGLTNVVAADISADGQFVIVAPAHGCLIVYLRASASTPLGRLRGPPQEWKAVSFVNSGSSIAAVNTAGRAYTWPFYGSVNDLRAVASKNMPFQGEKRVSIPADILCGLVGSDDDCTSVSSTITQQ